MEGDPYFAPERGLEYLFGVTTIDEREPRFRAFQGLDRRQEKAAFEQFIDFVCARLEQWPDLHVYHYAAYETSALKRLMAEHATREDELDDLLRREVFVDLYQVVRQSMRISHPSYSIKKVRTFFMEGAGQGAVTEGGDSILEFERWRRTGRPSHPAGDHRLQRGGLPLDAEAARLADRAEGRGRSRRPVSPFRGRSPSRTRRRRRDGTATRGDACRGRRADGPSPRPASGARHTGGAPARRSPQLPPSRGQARVVGVFRSPEEVAGRSARRHRGHRLPDAGRGCRA